MLERTDRRDGTDTASPFAVASIILSMGMLAIGNGLLFAYVPVRLGAAGVEPVWSGVILTCLSAGGLVGCLVTGRIVHRIGHARAYMTLAAMVILSAAATGIGVDVWLWTASRTLYGFAICSLFIISQSWLNDAVDNSIRGRVMAIFYVSYVVGLGIGSLTLSFVDIGTAVAPLIAVMVGAISMLPIGMTRLKVPEPSVPATIAFGAAWKVSPVGLAAMFASGGLSMMVAGFAPIHATAQGLTQQQVSLLLVCMQFGTILLQLPFGWISDRTDRRYVLVAATATVIVAGVVASQTQGWPFFFMVVVFLIWGGATESIYSLAHAHANDRAAKADLVTLASTMLFAWSVSGFVMPAVATALTPVYGTQAFMFVAISIAVAFCIFVIWRIVANPAQAEPAAGFAPLTAQAPIATDLFYAPPEDADRR